MRILIVANKMPYPAKDGGTIATLSLARSLHKCGCEVDLLAMNTPKHYCKVEDIPVEISSEISFHAVEVDTTIRPAKALKKLLFSLVFRQILARSERNQKQVLFAAAS